VLGLLALGAAERGARLLLSRQALVSRGAEWIWTPDGYDRHEVREDRDAVAFFAVRDFELDSPPERASVHVLADEAYVLYLNGRRVGSGVYFAGAPLDTYDIDGWLRPGWNRLAVELTSARAAGGLLLALVGDGERAPLVRSGGDWRAFADAEGVVDGIRRFADGVPVQVWQSPPHGGWGIPRLAAPRPTFDEAVAAKAGCLEVPVLEAPAGAPWLGEGGTSRDVADFGRPVSGYVVLRGLRDAPRRLRLEIGVDGAAEEAIDVLLAAGQTTWSAPEARTLRYVAAPGLPEGGSIGVIPVHPDFAAADALRASLRERGVFGVEPPPRD
jgi:hypothetical protein